MRVQLNFARAPFRNERLPWILFGLVAAVLLAASVLHGVVLSRYLMREQEELDVKVEALQQELSETENAIRRTENEIRTQRNDARTERIRFLANVYRQKSFSWTGLFNELEALTPAAVRITSISPAGIGGKEDEIEDEIEVELQVVARSLENVLEMVRRLEAAQYLTTVLPIFEAEGGERDGPGVSAVLRLQYLPHEGVADAPSGNENAAEGGSENIAGQAVPGDNVEKNTVDQAVPGDPEGKQTPGRKDAKKREK
jgi:Tfp pilus assembly protein PilN